MVYPVVRPVKKEEVILRRIVLLALRPEPSGRCSVGHRVAGTGGKRIA